MVNLSSRCYNRIKKEIIDRQKGVFTVTNEEFQKLVLQELSAIKAQQRENTDVINALVHNIEVANAKIDGLTLNTATKNAVIRLDKNIDRLATDISFLVRKAAEHDDDIRELRHAK